MRKQFSSNKIPSSFFQKSRLDQLRKGDNKKFDLRNSKLIGSLDLKPVRNLKKNFIDRKESKAAGRYQDANNI
jgi:hypothetical protein